MMDLQTINDLSREAAERAATDNKVPLVLTQQDIDDGKVRGIPNLGSHLPDGWRRVKLTEYAAHDPSLVGGFDIIALIQQGRGFFMGDNEGHGAFFVDKGGFGGTGEAALTFEEFCKYLWPGWGFAMVEEGQFQIKVGVFARVS